MSLPKVQPSSYGWKRMADAIVGQRYYNVVCPTTPRLEGQRILVTGGAHGIGLGISRGLVARGAYVVMCGRNEAEGAAAVAELGGEAKAKFVRLDLSDLTQIKPFVAQLQPFGAFDALVGNAGVWTKTRKTSAQGYELAYATNVLGHHALVLSMHKNKLFTANARVALTTGDIYTWAQDCTEDFEGGRDEHAYYARSKLGNVWQVLELQQRVPELTFVAVHPGVIVSELVESNENKGFFFRHIAPLLLLTVDEGANASLFAVTQPNVPRGAYLHNTYGWVDFAPNDPAANGAKAAACIDRVEQIVQPFI